MVIWGHEHECLIDPRLNPEMNFHVLQPGSSIATSLCAGEAVTKHIGILSITGQSFALEKIRLKTVRPFVMREVILADEKALKNVWKKNSNRTAVTAFLCGLVEDLIEEAVGEWMDAQEDEEIQRRDAPLPLIRLRVEYSAPEGGKFETENPQRFSNRFVGKVANVNDVIQFYRKKSGVARRTKGAATGEAINSMSLLEDYGGSIDNVKVENLVHEFLTSATLEILPSNGLGDAVGQFVDKDDKHAVEVFVDDSLKSYLVKLREYDDLNEEKILEVVERQKSYLEEMFAKGLVKPKRSRMKLKEKPDHWDSDIDGPWEEQPAARVNIAEKEEQEEEEEEVAPKRGAAKGRGARGRGAAASTRGRKAPAAKGKGKKKVVEEEEEEEDDADVMVIDDDEEEEEVVPVKTTYLPLPSPASSTNTPQPREESPSG